jgi:hypothetical protein
MHRVVVLLALVVVGCGQKPAPWLSLTEVVAPGVELYQSNDTTLLEPAAPIAVAMVKLDPIKVRLASVLSQDDVMGVERVDAIAARRGAVVAINGGFFNIKNGEPTGLLKVAGELVSDTEVHKGVVAIRAPEVGRTELDFDQVAVRVTLSYRADGRDWTAPIDGVDTTRERGKLMLYTPSYFMDSDTAPGGVEWILTPASATDTFRVIDIRSDAGHTPIPARGAVLSFGGLDVPAALDALVPDTVVALTRQWTSLQGSPPGRFESFDHVVNGAGLLKRDGRTPDNWQTRERLNPQNFIDMRHPRTVIGTDDRGAIWFVIVDGRRPDFSVGMTLPELVRLCDRLGLRNALNLDGGGSTTLVVKGAIVNRPTDPTGPRAVSDAIVATLR